MVDLQEFLDYMNSGKRVVAGSEVHRFMCDLSQDALRLTAELNNSYRTPEEIREILSRLTGRPMDDSLSMFPPFYTDCGKNLKIGKTCLSIPGAAFRIREALPLATGR